MKRHGRSITQYCVRACASATTTTAAILASHQIPLAYNAPRYSASRAIDITSPSSPPDSEYGVTSDETRREKRELGRAGGIRGAGSRGGLIEEERRRGPVAFRAFRCARSSAAVVSYAPDARMAARRDVRLEPVNARRTHLTYVKSFWLLYFIADMSKIQPGDDCFERLSIFTRRFPDVSSIILHLSTPPSDFPRANNKTKLLSIYPFCRA